MADIVLGTVETPGSKRLRDWRRIALFVAVVLLIGLAIRLTWTASLTQTGWETLAGHARDATLGWCLEQRTLGELTPAEQAEFWLAEVDRVLAENPASPDLLIGAALVLHEPTGGWPTIRPGESSEQRAEFRRQYSARCAKRCLELAERATKSWPEDPRCWRLRAWTLFDFPEPVGSLYEDYDSPWTFRDAQWRSVLEECIRHDPDNALYDYLIAEHLFRSSHTAAVGDPQETRFHVSDPARYAEAQRWFEPGASKLVITGIEEFAEPLEAFLNRTRVSRLECIAVRRELLSDTFDACRFADSLVVRQLNDAYEAFEQAEPQRGRKHWMLAVAVVDQCRRSPCGRSAMRLADLSLWPGDAYTGSKTRGLAGLCVTYPEFFSHEEYEQILQRVVQETADDTNTRGEWHSWSNSFANFFDADNAYYSDNTLYDSQLLVSLLLAPALLLLLIGVSFRLAARILAGRESAMRPRYVAWQPAVVWGVVFGVHFVVFGLAPAGAISQELQSLTVVALGLLVFAAWFGIVLLVVLWNPKSAVGASGRFRFKMSLRGMLLLVAAIAGAIAVVRYVTIYEFLGVGSLPEISMPAREVADHKDLETGLRVVSKPFDQDEQVRPPLIQWMRYGGASVVIVIGLCSIAVLQTWRIARQQRAQRMESAVADTENRRRISAGEWFHSLLTAGVNPAALGDYWRVVIERKSCGQVLAMVGRSALPVAIVALLLYLALAPLPLSDVEARYQAVLDRRPPNIGVPDWVWRYGGKYDGGYSPPYESLAEWIAVELDKFSKRMQEERSKESSTAENPHDPEANAAGVSP
jgi:hypothetical protein